MRLRLVERSGGAGDLAEVVAGGGDADVVAEALAERQALAVALRRGLGVLLDERNAGHVERPCQEHRVVGRLRRSEALVRRAAPGVVVALEMRQPRGGEQRSSAHRRRHVAPGGPQRSVEPVAPLADVARAPEAIEIAAEVQRAPRRLRQQDLERRAEVVELAVESIELLARAAVAEHPALLASRRGADHRHPQVGRGLLRRPRPGARAGSVRTVASIEKRGSAAEPASRCSRLRSTRAARRARSDRAPTARARRRRRAGPPRPPCDVEAAGKGRQATQQRLLVRLEQVVAPVERAAQRPLARRQVARARRSSSAEPPRPSAPSMRRRAQHGHARGRELDRQRQAVQPAADLRDGRAASGVSSKLGSRARARATNSATAGWSSARRRSAACASGASGSVALGRESAGRRGW